MTIKIREGDGHTVATLSLGRRTIAALHVARYVCRLPRGAYRFSVYARDEAGNPQTHVGSNVLIVK